MRHTDKPTVMLTHAGIDHLWYTQTDTNCGMVYRVTKFVIKTYNSNNNNNGLHFSHRTIHRCRVLLQTQIVTPDGEQYHGNSVCNQLLMSSSWYALRVYRCKYPCFNHVCFCLRIQVSNCCHPIFPQVLNWHCGQNISVNQNVEIVK